MGAAGVPRGILPREFEVERERERRELEWREYYF
jgi:hypothetical protein